MTSGSKQVGVIYYYLNTFRSYYKRFNGKENTFLITWDSAGKTQRHEILPEYKSGRKKFPEEFYQQMEDLYKAFQIIGIKQYKIPTIEADDIVGSLTFQARKLGKSVMIISGDHDFEQLISNSVTILAPSPVGESVKDKDYVLKKYGLLPNEIPDMMCLTGDPTDYISGIPKVGEVTALKLLLAADHNLDNIIKNIDQLTISASLKEKVKANWHLVERNKQLVKINCHLNNIKIDLQRKETDFEKLKQYFEGFEFKQFLDHFDKWHSAFSSSTITTDLGIE